MRFVACCCLLWCCTLGCQARTAPTSSSVEKPFPFFTASRVEMTYLPGGTFTMGNAQGEPDEAPEHPVTVTSFAIDRTEVTHAMFAKLQLPNPSKWQDDPKRPVNQVRWRDAKEYCNERSLAEGLDPCYDQSSPGWPCDFLKNGYRLPTEAEWEYAARAGKEDQVPTGQEKKLPSYAWFAGNSAGRTHPVGSRRPNAWGLYGMYGNVAEWCQDVYDPEFYARSPDHNPQGAAAAEADAKRVVRGGSWKATANMCRASFRQGKTTGDSDACFTSDDCGFRCVRAVTKADVEQITRPQKAAP